MSTPEPQMATGEGIPLHCITCSDQALPARVVSVAAAEESAVVLVEGSDERTEVDISLVDAVEMGDVLMVHGGIALACIKTGTKEGTNYGN